jgi:hypothetical protein
MGMRRLAASVAAALLLACLAAQQEPPLGCHCEYGMQPSMWLDTASEGEGWASLNGEMRSQAGASRCS